MSLEDFLGVEDKHFEFVVAYAAESCHVTDSLNYMYEDRVWESDPEHRHPLPEVQPLCTHSDAKSPHTVYTFKFSFLPAKIYRVRTAGQGRRLRTGRWICACAYMEAAITVWKYADWQMNVDEGFCFRGKSKSLALKLS